MKATQLRLGNYLQGKNTVVKVTRIFNEDEIGIGSGDPYTVSGENPCLLPIPLTEEWLCKFGFDKICIPTSINGINITFFKKGDFVVYLLSDSFEVELITKSGNQFNLFKNFKEEIHVLQNLYFALTGEELNIEI